MIYRIIKNSEGNLEKRLKVGRDGMGKVVLVLGIAYGIIVFLAALLIPVSIVVGLALLVL